MTRLVTYLAATMLALSAQATGISYNPPPSTGGGGGGLTYQDVTATVTLTGTDGIHADVTALTGHTAITLMAASAGDTIEVLVTDATGAAMSGAYLIRVLCAGSDTIMFPHGEGAGAVFVQDGAMIRLKSDGVSQWSIVSRRGSGIDPYTVTGIWDWKWSAKGISKTGLEVDSWADPLGTLRTVSASGTARPEQVERTTTSPSRVYGGAAGITFDGVNTVMSLAGQDVSSGAFQATVIHAKTLWNSAVSGSETFFGIGWAQAHAGIGLRRIFGTGGDTVQHDYVFDGAGYTAGEGPRCITQRYWKELINTVVAMWDTPVMMSVELSLDGYLRVQQSESLRLKYNLALPAQTSATYTLGANTGGGDHLKASSLYWLMLVNAGDDGAHLNLDDLAIQAFGSVLLN